MTEVPRWWVDGVRAALAGDGGRSAELAESFAVRVPAGYVERTAPGVAAADLVEFQALGEGPSTGGAELRMAVQPDPDPGAGMFRFRVYGRRGVELSAFVPILESFGLTVVEAVPYRIADEGLHLDDFGLRARGRWPFDPSSDGSRLVAAVQAAWQAEAEVDSLNRLVVCAGIDWREVAVLRAYRRYRRQVGTPWSDRQLDDPLAAFPAVAVALLRYFSARFDPSVAHEGAGDDGIDAARAAVLASLASVERLEQDQVLRAYLALMDATVRTSCYARTASGERLPTLTLKLQCALIPELPPPRPNVETFVYSPRVEGLHLRGGPIARGGIRWSDRRDDLRTEVLGLVRAQVLKNAGIVPTGAKGGFVCKNLEPDGGDVAGEVRECYRRFVSGLLDITDNVVGGRVVPPPGVCPADGEDSYLVVAADRGTAAFSDLANEISADHDFWLGDAFASGGRHGYDHKAMGITARGAWVAARQHFRQLGIDPEREEIRVLGVGDMSGDVFGNAMLQSRTIKLVAAFDHRHVFIDPEPDPERSFVARRALFELPGSSWAAYDRSAISPGGGVWSRTIKAIPLSPAAMQMLGLAGAHGAGFAVAGGAGGALAGGALAGGAVAGGAVAGGAQAGGAEAGLVSPPEVISAILTASADLLWLGGIGTFVKAAGESHADVGDRANDVIRVDADRVRARVVVEGGNLGFTQRARIAYSRRGGKINTDFIDNAAGVAISDYEVNLKILLAQAVEQGRLTADERDRLLREVQDDVADAVLRDVGLTALAVTRAVPASAANLDAYDALMTDLEAAGRLDRKVESLPTPEDIALRRAAGAGLTRPEAAVVLALAKSDLVHALEQSSVVTDALVHDAVTSYFPAPVVTRFADLIGAHRLYPQLAATRMAHEIVDRLGVTWAHETADEFGVSLAEVGRAYWNARHVLGAQQRWRQVDDLATSLSADAEEALEVAVAEAVDALARRYLGDSSDGYGSAADDRIVALALETAPARGDGARRARSLLELGVEHPVAESFAKLATLALAADAGAVIRARGVSANEALMTLEAFDAFDAALGLAGFRATLDRLVVPSRWGRWQQRRLGDDIAKLRCDAVRSALGVAPGVGDPAAAMAEWLSKRATMKARFHRLAAQLALPEADGQSVAALAVRALSELVAAS